MLPSELIRTLTLCLLLHQEDWFPFVRCLEASTELDVQKRASKCAKTADLAWKDIHACAKGELLHASSAFHCQHAAYALAL